MAQPQRTQKQVAEKYKGNLDYFRKGHYLRRLRGIVFTLVALGSIATVLTFRFWGNPQLFSTGPISENHASFANNCQVCHVGAEPDVARALQLDRAIVDLQNAPEGRIDRLRQWITQARPASWSEKISSLPGVFAPGHLLGLADQALQKTSLTRMDLACLKCHDAQRLHQPQASALALRGAIHQLPLVTSGSCANCHREHIGHQRMASPKSDSCETCHNDLKQLTATSQILTFPGKAPTQPAVFDLGDGLRHFVVPRPVPPQLVAFKSFAQGHPDFDYQIKEGRDPGTLKFGHQRHFQDDIPPLNGHRLTCADCHQPSANGAFMEPVTYAQNCAKCHALQLDPALPALTIPHGNSEQARLFARNITTQLSSYAQRELKLTDRVQLGQFIVGEFGKLRARGMDTVEELERRIFFVGDPPREDARVSPRTNPNQLTIACTKCHNVARSVGTAAPVIAPAASPDRWLNRGPFTHAPHTQLDCAECHDSAKNSLVMASKSTRTADLLLPRKAMCVECHRPLETSKIQSMIAPLTAPPADDTPAAKQRREGGIKQDCQDCHGFHAPPEAAKFAQSLEAHPTP